MASRMDSVRKLVAAWHRGARQQSSVCGETSQVASSLHDHSERHVPGAPKLLTDSIQAAKLTVHIITPARM